MSMYRIFVAACLLSSVAWAAQEAGPVSDWTTLRAKNLQCGFSEVRVEQTLALCKRSGLSATEADALLGPAYAARDESLPSECILLRVEEGLAKQVPWAAVQAAALQRLDCMRKANVLVTPIRAGRGNEHEHLIMHTCMALESGLPEQVLSELFNRPGRLRYGRLIHVVEAGETLQLAGLDPEQTSLLMNDCLDRNLNRVEVFRMVDFVVAEHRAGKDFETIHKSLWITSD